MIGALRNRRIKVLIILILISIFWGTMNFDWQDYLKLAEYMNKNIDAFPNKEACCRASISRAYYSVFCTVRNYIKKNDGEEFSGSSHEAIPRYLMNSNNKIRQRIGRQLKNFSQDRVRADYYDSWNKPQNTVLTAQKSASLAKRILSGLDDLM
ncbi:HEPN domain-containing protein [Desulfobacterales bacterium HSG2]|nr:HEPN domain-containing protein [Desulfobacterales bacterium HSG2]